MSETLLGAVQVVVGLGVQFGVLYWSLRAIYRLERARSDARRR